MNYQVQLNNGQIIDLKNAEIEAAEFTATLNEQKITFVNLGGAVINKHLIASVIPINQTETEA